MYLIHPTVGIFSIVAVDEQRVSAPSPVPRVLVRARLRSHLQVLLARFPDLLGTAQIEDTPAADYAHRLSPLPRATWGEIMRRLGESVTYPNVKNAFAESPIDPPETSRRVVRAIHEVWAALRSRLSEPQR